VLSFESQIIPISFVDTASPLLRSHECSVVAIEGDWSDGLRDDGFLRVQYMCVGNHFASVGDAATADDLFLAVDSLKLAIALENQETPSIASRCTYTE
jgi:hypothetical protein